MSIARVAVAWSALSVATVAVLAALTHRNRTVTCARCNGIGKVVNLGYGPSHYITCKTCGGTGVTR